MDKLDLDARVERLERRTALQGAVLTLGLLVVAVLLLAALVRGRATTGFGSGGNEPAVVVLPPTMRTPSVPAPVAERVRPSEAKPLP
jgi:hypothetical protein